MRYLLLLAILLSSSAHAADIAQEYRYQVLVKETVSGIDYKDAIYYTEAQWADLKQADVNTEIKKRTDNFKAALENPQPPVVPTRAQLVAERDRLRSEADVIDEQIRTR